jgi:hypothetical protein
VKSAARFNEDILIITVLIDKSELESNSVWHPRVLTARRGSLLENFLASGYRFYRIEGTEDERIQCTV